MNGATLTLQRKEERMMSSPLRSEAASALKQFKMEVAGELGLPDYDSIDKGNLSSRENGSVGGNMTKKMVAFAEQSLAGSAGRSMM